ncbi:ATP synthase in type III secretion protein N [Sphingomonas guangdongensis]|uniref:ATP synthase in type III secretion protein N n=1 Tax=Sphingomonas guangdongensis TaxID=1141890 RepID=A0A285QY89_9SPHN|nr:FliI/YscN family ATPase [Sphingomonas guangdongensis]SOB86438.1 ATP synthase in type III secretion protein N [Sphingomonas guangdongensis]
MKLIDAPGGLLSALAQAPLTEQRGRLVGAVGTTIRARGLRGRIGDTVEIVDAERGTPLMAEIVGLADGELLLTPLGELRGLSPTAEVVLRPSNSLVPIGPALLGRVVDAHCRPLDGRGAIARDQVRALDARAPDPMTRAPVDQVLETGVRAIDGLLTLGRGQRVGVFAGAGGGKSTLLAMLARQTRADAIVIALIGERGREVREFVEEVLGPEGLARSTIVVATSDRPAMERVRAAQVATAIAEGLRDQGRHVLLLMDSVTRYARALREIGLAAGEPAVRRGFPPSVFAELPRLFERAGNGVVGGITGIYTVLLEEEDGDPIGEEVRSLLDGHIHLSRALGARGHYPAVDIGGSLSRLFPTLASATQAQAARRVRAMLAKLADIELLLQLGEYRAGQDRLADVAIAQREAIDSFLRQDAGTATPYSTTVAMLRGLDPDG